MSTLAVVEEILRETQVPMSVRQIVEYAGTRLPTRSKTPDTVVARDLSMDIKRRGETSVFLRTAPGRYAIREIHMGALAPAQSNGQPAEQSAGQPAEQSAGRSDGQPGGQPAEQSAGQPHALTEQRGAAAAPMMSAAEAPPTSVLASAMKAERAAALPAKKPPAADEQTGTLH